MDAPILHISVELHAEIARFLSPADCSRLAATCSILKPIYCSNLVWSRYLPPSISSVVEGGVGVQWSARALYVDLLIRAEVNLKSGSCQFTPLAPGRCCLVEDALQVEYGVGDEVLLSHIHSVLKPFPRTLEHRTVEGGGSTNGSTFRDSGGSYDEEQEERPVLARREYEIGSVVSLEPIVLPLRGPRVNKVHLVEITPDVIAIGHSLNGGSISLFSRRSHEHIATRMTGLRSGLVPIEMTIAKPYICVLTLGGMLWAWRFVYDDQSEYACDVVFLGRVRVSTSQYRDCKAPHFVIAPRDTEQWNELRMKGITAEITRQWDENHYIVATDIFEDRVKSWQLSALPNRGIVKMFERDDGEDDEDDVMPLDCSTTLAEREYRGVRARGMFCHDRRVIAMASNQCLVWTADDSLLMSAPEVTDIRPIREPVCACMRGSSLVVAYEDGELYSVDVVSGAKFHVSMPVPCTCITLSHVARFVIVGTVDGYVRLCDMKLGKELYEMAVPGSVAVDRIHFDASSFILVAYGRAGGMVCRFAGKPTLFGNGVRKDCVEEKAGDVLVLNLSSDASYLSRYELKRAKERCCTPVKYMIRWAGGIAPPLLAVVVIIGSLWLMREHIAFKMHNAEVEALIYFWVVVIFFAIAIMFCGVIAGVTLFGLSYAVQNDMLHGHDHA